MDDEDRYSASSAESERENEQDEVMEDADDGDNDGEPEEDNNDDDNGDEEQEQEDGDNNDHENDNENDNEAGNGNENDDDKRTAADGANGIKTEEPGDESQAATNPDEPTQEEPSESQPKSPTPGPAPPATVRLRPTIRPEALTAKYYDVVPTMAAPQSTSVNAMAITPDLRYWITGGSDGYIRKYDGPSTLNGKLQLTVAQKHPFVDSVTKAGVLMSYWENEEPIPPGRGDQEHVLSPVYSLAVHSDALWLLSGLESGGINLQSVRHDEGKRIHCMQQHSYAVSVLTLAQDEKSVLSGGWDKNIFDWDLNTGQTKRSFDGRGGQISAIELRPASGAPVPAEADDPLPSNTISTNNGVPFTNGSLANGVNGDSSGQVNKTTAAGGGDGQASPAHESLFGGSDAGSLFGETAGEQPFGNDDDEYNPTMGMMPGHEGGMDHSADMAMASMEMEKDAEKEAAPPVQPPAEEGDGESDAMDVDSSAAPPAEEAQAAAETATKEQTQPADTSEAGTPQPDQPEPQPSAEEGERSDALKRSQSPMVLTSDAPPQQFDATQTSLTTFMSTAIDGTIRIWDRRVQNPVARIGIRHGVPPWCMGACWSPDGNMIYAGRRNGIVEEFDVRKAKRGWESERSLKFPLGSGAVSAVRAMPNGRHLVW